MRMKKQAAQVHNNAGRYGFGPEIMKRLKVCLHCGSIVKADCYVCRECGGRLPRKTLFQLYQSRHRLCPVCDTVLSNRMRYCPHCGMQQTDAVFKQSASEAQNKAQFLGGA